MFGRTMCWLTDLYDILFIQELFWDFIQFVSFTSSPGGQEVIGAPILLDCPDFALLSGET